MKTHFACTAIITAVVSTLAGCSTPPANSDTSVTSVSGVTVEPTQQSASQSPDADAQATQQAIAAQTAQFAAEIEQAMATAATRPVAKKVVVEAPVAVKPEPSEVNWETLLKSSKTATPQSPEAAKPVAPQQVAAVEQVTDPRATRFVQPSQVEMKSEEEIMPANARASLDDMPAPMVVPEGEEISPAKPVATPVPATAVTTSESNEPSLGTQLTKRITDNPRDIAAHLDYQLHQFTTGQSVPQLTSMASLPTEDREIVAALMDGLTNFRAAVDNDVNAPLSKKVRPLVDIADRLRSQADLTVPTVALCKRVDGFGNYEPFEPATFPAGKESPAIIYCEVANFSSQKMDGKRWQTTLTHTATLYRDSGVPVLNDKTVEFVDQSRNRRNDFFVVKLLKLPSTLTPGRYVLKVTVVDKQSNRMAEGSMNLTIGTNMERDLMGKTE